MATSSIFAQVRITEQEKAEAFIDALEAAENRPKRRPSISAEPLLTDYDAIRQLMAKGNVME